MIGVYLLDVSLPFQLDFPSSPPPSSPVSHLNPSVSHTYIYTIPSSGPYSSHFILSVITASLIDYQVAVKMRERLFLLLFLVTVISRYDCLITLLHFIASIENKLTIETYSSTHFISSFSPTLGKEKKSTTSILSLLEVEAAKEIAKTVRI